MSDKRILDENRLHECKLAYDLYKTGKYAHRDIAEKLLVSHSTVQRRISLYEHHLAATGGQPQKAAPVSDSHNGDYQFSAWKPKEGDLMTAFMEAMLAGDHGKAMSIMGNAMGGGADMPQHSVSFPEPHVGRKPADPIRDISMIERQGDDMAAYLTKTEKAKQRAQDNARIANAKNRNAYRLVNAIEAQYESMADIYSRHAPKGYVRKTYRLDGKSPVGILHLSDLHLNEIVDTIGNKFDVKVGARRLRYLVDRAIHHFKSEGAKKVLIAATGDFVKNAKRLDEVMNNSANRMAFVFVVAEIIGQMIEHLVAEGFEVHFAGVCGNESRVHEEIGTTRILFGESFDFAVYGNLYFRYRHICGFVIGEDPNECVVDVNGQGVLLMHGHGGGRGQPGAKAQKAISRYASLRQPIIVRMVLSGHIHEASIADYHARSASPVGGNGYSEYALGLVSRASQNVHLVWPETAGGGFDGFKIDLQRVPDDYPAYDVTDALVVYDRSILSSKTGEHRPYAIV